MHECDTCLSPDSKCLSTLDICLVQTEHEYEREESGGAVEKWRTVRSGVEIEYSTFFKCSAMHYCESVLKRIALQMCAENPTMSIEASSCELQFM